MLRQFFNDSPIRMCLPNSRVSDASERVYPAVVYLRTEFSNGCKGILKNPGIFLKGILCWALLGNQMSCKAIDLFGLCILFSQYRSCDNSLENCFFQFSSYSRAYLRVIYEKTKIQVRLGPLSGNKTQAKKVY